MLCATHCILIFVRVFVPKSRFVVRSCVRPSQRRGHYILSHHHRSLHNYPPHVQHPCASCDGSMTWEFPICSKHQKNIKRESQTIKIFWQFWWCRRPLEFREPSGNYLFLQFERGQIRNKVRWCDIRCVRRHFHLSLSQLSFCHVLHLSTNQNHLFASL